MYTYKARIIKVVDGDTVDCKLDLGFYFYAEKRVRLSGIDAPETNSPDKLLREAAAKTKARLINILENREIYVVTELDKTDKYGRVLGVFYENLKDVGNAANSINIKLVQEGLASRYSGGKRV